MNPQGPLVSVAALCDNVLDEKDGRVSCIRFLDKIELNATYSAPLQPGETPKLPIPHLQLTGLLALKSGNFIGKKMMRINILKPDGQLMQVEGQMSESLPLLFEGGEHGVQIILKLMVKVEEEGLYHFDVLLDEDEPIARIPLRVTITHTQADVSRPQNLMTDDKEDSQKR
jgi:hypothetical protein